MKIHPLRDQVLVELIEETDQVRNGIVIPDAAREKSIEARVLALGTGGKDKDDHEIVFDVKVGDRVLTAKYGGVEVELEGKKYTLIKQSDILAAFKT
jgi:chaperonin GroES